MLKHSLPAIYQRLLPDEVLSLEIEERRSTCHSCAMARAPESGSDPFGLEFSASTKCCTYWPSLPNYLVGGILSGEAADEEEGRGRLLCAINEGARAHRLGVSPPEGYLSKLHAERATGFGKNEGLRCPYFDQATGGCTIWRHRDSDCSTFFCKFENARHFEFWRQLGTFLAGVERKLSTYAVSAVEPQHDFAADKPGFYRACYQAVCALEPDALPQIVGDDWSRSFSELFHHMVELHRHVEPRRVRIARGLKVLESAHHVAITTYNEYDPVVLPRAAYQALLEHTSEGISVDDLKAMWAPPNADEREHVSVETLFEQEVLAGE